MTNKSKLYVAILALSGIGSANAAFVDDLAAIDGYVVYGDGVSYSLPISQLEYDNTLTNPGDTFYVASSPGSIKDLTVIATGGSGTGVNTNHTGTNDGVDEAYETPNGSPSNSDPYWSPTADNIYAPDGTSGDTAIANNGDTTWDVDLLTLGDSALTFFFNNNQEDSGGSSSQSLAVWAELTITDAAGDIVDLSAIDFDLTGVYQFTNDNGLYATVTEGGGGEFQGFVGDYRVTSNSDPDVGIVSPDGNYLTATDYVLSGGEICVAHNTTSTSDIPIPVPCGSDISDLIAAGAVPPTYDEVTGAINHNLGANQAAYAIVFPELNEQIAYMFDNSDLFGELTDYTLHVDVRMGCDNDDDAAEGFAPQGTYYGVGPLAVNERGTCLNNGYEQIFLLTSEQDPPRYDVPAPAPLALLGLGLAAIGWTKRKA